MIKEHPVKLSILVLVSLVVGFFGGNYYAIKRGLLSDSGAVQIEKVVNLHSKTRSSEVNFDQYWTVWDKIKEKYAGEVDEVDMFYGSIQGMVNALDDPYSKYMPPKESEEFSKNLSGEFEGIGAEIGMRDNQLTIIAPLDKSPAKKSGIKPGDKILAINGESTQGITLEKAVQRIRGEKGTTVTLTVLHKEQKEPVDIDITRDKINIPTVDHKIKDGNLGYLRIRYFNADTESQLNEAIKELLAKKPEGIILDLRRNPGGYLQSSIKAASEWIEEGVIVSEGKNGNINERLKPKGEHRLKDIPTVALVNEGTASGAEIVAGALKDYNKATLVGTTTFGKGSVQKLEFLPDGSALKLTVAKWYTPNGNQIDKKGIKPDITVEEMYKENKDDEGRVTDVEDLGLRKAIEVLKSKISKSNKDK